MAVKVNNIENIRKSKRWNERDDASLSLLLRKKIRELDISIRESNTPYERSRLKETKQNYKIMLDKVMNGTYNGDIIFSEMQAAAALRGQENRRLEKYSDPRNGRAYVNSYMEMDFDYENAFRRTRYYGFTVPFIMFILIALFLCVFVMGAFLTSDIKAVATENDFNINAIFTYKLGPDTLDLEITNDGNWPSGTYSGTVPTQGVEYKDASNVAPEKVLLYADMGMTSIDISAFDIIKAWFKTPMLAETRLDFIENLDEFQGTSYYYLIFLSGTKADDLVIRKVDGAYDFSVIIQYLGVYGTIMCLIIAFLLGVIDLITILFRIFFYTSRKIHLLDFLCFIFCILTFICPALASVEGTALGTSFYNYFLSLTNSATFLATAGASVGVGLLILVPIGCSLLLMLIPIIFRNKLKKRVSSVPRGNKLRPAISDPYVMKDDVMNHLV